MHKTYIKPTSEMFEVEVSNIICTSKTTNSSEHNDSSHEKEIEEVNSAIQLLEAEIAKREEAEKINFPEKINLSEKYNLYGINIKESPNEQWEYIGSKTSPNGNRLDEYIINIEQNPSKPFERCKAIVIDGKYTNFCFESIPYDEDLALNIIFVFARNFLHKGEFTHQECRETYIDKCGNYSSFELVQDEDDLRFYLSTSSDTMDVTVYTTFVCASRPAPDENYITDYSAIFEQGKSMLETCVGLCQISGQVAGTVESIRDCNLLMFELTGREKLSATDRGMSSLLQKDDKLAIVQEDEVYAVYTSDGKTKAGYVPDDLHIGFGIMFPHGFIKEPKVLANSDGAIRVIVTLGM